MNAQSPDVPPEAGQDFQYLGMALIFLRLIRGLSQGELAERAGIRPNQVSRYETGQVLPQLAQVERLTIALGVEPLGFFAFMAQVRSLVLTVEAADEATSRVTADLHSLLFNVSLLQVSFGNHLRGVLAKGLEEAEVGEPTYLQPIAGLTPELLEAMAAEMREMRRGEARS